MGEVVLFYSPTMKRLAKAILSNPVMSNSLMEGNLEWKSFPDSFPNLFIRDVESIKGKHAVILVDFYDPASIFCQISVIYALPSYLVKSLLVVLCYFPTGTMERIDEEGQIATAHSLARIFSATPHSQTGPTKLLLTDLHALQERFYFSDNILPVLTSAIPFFKKRWREYLEENGEQNNTAIVFPDEGASKRFGNMFSNDFDIIVCSKIRHNDERIVTIREGDPQGKHVIIVDDLVQTGGTLIQCQQALLRAGAAKISAYVTHAIFPKDSWKKFIKKKDGEGSAGDRGFERFFITDTCPSVAEVLHNQEPFEVITVAPVIIEQINRLCLH